MERKVMSIAQQRKVQEGIMKPLHEACNVINSFKLVDYGHAIVAERNFESIGMLNILKYFEADEQRRTILASKHDSDGKIISRRKYVTGNVPDADANYVKGLYMVDFRGCIKPEYGDAIAEEIRSRIFLGIRKEKGYFLLEEDLRKADIVMMPYAESPSTMKNSCIYYATVDKNDLMKEAVKRFKEIDDLSGGSLSYKYNQLLKKDVTMADVRKIADRLGICTTTPMMKIGHVNNIFFMDAELNYGSDYEENNEISAEIGSNFADGSVRFNGETMYTLYKAKYPRLKPWMMFGLSLQGRCDTTLMKAHGRHFRGRLIKRYCRAMLKQSPEKCYLAYNGKLYTAKDLVELDKKGKLDRMLEKVDIVGTKDEFKAINMAKLKDGCNLYAVAMTNATEGKLSNQALAKVAKDYPREIKHFAVMAAVKAFANKCSDYVLRFDKKKDYLKLAGQVYENKLAAAKEKASKDRHIGESVIKADDSFVRSMTASANIPVNSLYLRLTPDDSIILTGGTSVLGGTWVDYIEPGGMDPYKVHALEVYCPAYEELSKDKQFDNMLADTLRMCVGIKYPSQGLDEYAVLKCISLDEIKGRIDKLNVDNALKADLVEFYETCPKNCVMMPADNTWKNQCAGSDFDGDDFVLYFEEVEYDDDNNLIHYGLFEELNEETGECNYCMPGFTSLAIRKYAVKNDNIGKAAIICYK